jgi:hypothetical protein
LDTWMSPSAPGRCSAVKDGSIPVTGCTMVCGADGLD